MVRFSLPTKSLLTTVEVLFIIFNSSSGKCLTDINDQQERKPLTIILIYTVSTGAGVLVSRLSCCALALDWEFAYRKRHRIATNEDPEPLRGLLLEILKEDAGLNCDKTIIYSPEAPWSQYDTQSHWSRTRSRFRRPLGTVILDQQQKDTVVDDIKNFLSRSGVLVCRFGVFHCSLLHQPPSLLSTFLFTSTGSAFDPNLRHSQTWDLASNDVHAVLKAHQPSSSLSTCQIQERDHLHLTLPR